MKHIEQWAVSGLLIAACRLLFVELPPHYSLLMPAVYYSRLTIYDSLTDPDQPNFERRALTEGTVF
jgi:hypothetical protein